MALNDALPFVTVRMLLPSLARRGTRIRSPADAKMWFTGTVRAERISKGKADNPTAAGRCLWGPNHRRLPLLRFRLVVLVPYTGWNAVASASSSFEAASHFGSKLNIQYPMHGEPLRARPLVAIPCPNLRLLSA